MKDRKWIPDADLALWRTYVRDITPRTPHEEHPHVKDAPPMPSSETPLSPVLVTVKSPKGLPPTVPIALSRRELRALKFTARCDLHGKTIAKAFSLMEAFLKRSQEEHHRTVLIITGKGRNSPEQNATLRTLLPEWLLSPPLNAYARSFAPAAPNHGGSGALYVFLRKV